jgi:predicted Zn-dependent peptidase
LNFIYENINGVFTSLSYIKLRKVMFMKKRFLLLFSVILLAFILATGMLSADRGNLPDVKEFTLPNGLVLLVIERHDSPTVAAYRFHRVGSIHEWPGMTGAAHLLEHMKFKGTEKIGTWNYEAEKPIMEKIDRLLDEIDKERAKGLTAYQAMDQKKIDSLWEQVRKLQNEQRKYIRKNEVWSLFDSHGGKGMNASTGFDRTDYYINLPSNKLELWAFIESDRLKNPVFREFYSERDVVHEERRMGINNPSGALFESFIATMFKTYPYGHPIVGFDSDIESMRRHEVLSFLRKYYSPNNTILVLAGDVKAQDAYNLVRKYFGDMPWQPEPKPQFQVEPPQRGERRVEVEFDAQPMIRIGFHGPKPGHPDQYALDVLMSILSDGRTSRFYENIVRNNIAFQCSGSLWSMAYTNLMVIGATPKQGVSTSELEEAIYKEIDRLKTEPVTEWELEKVKNQTDRRFISILRNNMDLAEHLAYAQGWTGSWRNIDEREKIRAVTAEDVMRVADKYLIRSNRTVATLVPPYQPGSGDPENTK